MSFQGLHGVGFDRGAVEVVPGGRYLKGMGFALGIYTSDPNLLRCELARLRPELVLGEPASEPMGAGWYGDDSVLLQRYSAKVRPESLDELGGVLESDALLVHGGPLPFGMSLDENTQPFRFRQWMFVNHGVITGAEKFRALAMDGLPEHLARTVKGATADEVAFALFLAALRETGRTDDPNFEPKVAAQALGRAARKIEALSTEASGRVAALGMMATNNRVLVACRLGERPVYFRLMEGTTHCDVCHLSGSTDSEAAVRAHMRRKSVVVATQVRDPNAWMALESGEAIGVGRSLHVDRIKV